MHRQHFVLTALMVFIGAAPLFYSSAGISQQRATPPPDAVQDTQTPRQVETKRPEQQRTKHDQSDILSGTNAPPSSPIFENQPDQGKALGFDFARDPLNAKRPMRDASPGAIESGSDSRRLWRFIWAGSLSGPNPP